MAAPCGFWVALLIVRAIGTGAEKPTRASRRRQRAAADALQQSRRDHLLRYFMHALRLPLAHDACRMRARAAPVTSSSLPRS
jgi:hypothetical protein